MPEAEYTRAIMRDSLKERIAQDYDDRLWRTRERMVERDVLLPPRLSRWQLEAEARAASPVSPERSRIEAEVDAKLNAMLGKKESADHALILLAVRRGARLVCWVSGLLLAALLLIRLIFWFYDLMGLR